MTGLFMDWKLQTNIYELYIIITNKISGVHFFVW